MNKERIEKSKREKWTVPELTPDDLELELGPDTNGQVDYLIETMRYTVARKEKVQAGIYKLTLYRTGAKREKIKKKSITEKEIKFLAMVVNLSDRELEYNIKVTEDLIQKNIYHNELTARKK